MKKYNKVSKSDTLEVGRIFMSEEKMNNFYLRLCDKYERVELKSVNYGETITAIWHVSGEF